MIPLRIRLILSAAPACRLFVVGGFFNRNIGVNNMVKQKLSVLVTYRMAILNRFEFELNRFELNRFELNSLKLEQLNECIASKLGGLIFCLYWVGYCVGGINYPVAPRSLRGHRDFEQY
jgi:hypothetical protein